MTFRWRIVLPLGHFVVDCLILALWLWQAQSLYRPKAVLPARGVEPVFFLQEGGSVQWNPIFHPPDEYLLLAAGTFPALLISAAIRPQWHLMTPAKLWDPIWFVVHESASVLIWFVIGRLLDSGFLRIRRLMVVYFAGRLGLALLLTTPYVAHIGWRILVLFWLGFCGYLIFSCVRWAVSKARLDSSEATLP